MEVIFKEETESASYSFETKKDYHDKVEYQLLSGELATLCEETALAAWKALGCRDGGRIDLRMDPQGIPNFIEVNPLAGLNPIDSDLPILCRLSGIPYQTLIRQIMESAKKRLELKKVDQY
jgi:D-alanine-D-alanine ligase